MARLFISTRELDFISDITKELIKDVVGQKIIYYPVSELKTKSHDVYDEALQKIFDSPIMVDALVSNEFQKETVINKFGIDMTYSVEVFIQHRDLVDKGIDVVIGDYFSFSDIFYEITEHQYMRNIYGMAENIDGVKILGTKVRQNQFTQTRIYGPTSNEYTDPDAVQKTFVQQRGFEENAEGKTNDVRDLVKRGTLDQPISGPREVSENGDPEQKSSAFYDEE